VLQDLQHMLKFMTFFGTRYPYENVSDSVLRVQRAVMPWKLKWQIAWHVLWF